MVPHLLRSSILCATVWVAFATIAIEAQENSTTVSFKVTRESAYSYAAVNMNVYVNEKKVGTLANGDTVTLSVPVSDDNKYTYHFSDWSTRIYGKRQVYANPGEQVEVVMGPDWVSMAVKQQTVVPRFPFSVYVYTDRPIEMELDGIAYTVKRPMHIQLPRTGLLSDVIKVKYSNVGDAKKHEFPLFVSPARSSFIDVSKKSTDDANACTNVEHFHQLEYARRYHFNDPNTSPLNNIDKFETDIRALRTTGVSRDGVSIYDTEVAILRELQKLKSESIFGDALRNFLVAGLSCGVEYLVTGSPPSRTDVAAEALQALAETTGETYARNTRLAELVKEHDALRRKSLGEAVAMIRTHSQATPADWTLHKKVLGTWDFIYPLDQAKHSYEFTTDGTLYESKDGNVLSSGRYTVVRDKVIVRWRSGAFEKASWNDTADGANYVIDEHSEEAQVGLSIPFKKR